MVLVCIVWLGLRLGLGLGLGLGLRLRVTRELDLVIQLAFSLKYLRKLVEYIHIIRNVL